MHSNLDPARTAGSGVSKWCTQSGAGERSRISPATARSWLDRWDRVMAQHFPDRERELDIVLTTIEQLPEQPRRIVDLGCGPGSFALRTAARFPDTEILGLDLDPFLLELARAANGSARIRFADADLRTPQWTTALGAGSVDAVYAIATLHYLDPKLLPSLAAALAEHLRPGGVFLAADAFAITAPVLTPEAGETWADWWAAAAAKPEFAGLLRLRTTRCATPSTGPEPTVHDIVEAFRAAGFTETSILRRHGHQYLVRALR